MFCKSFNNMQCNIYMALIQIRNLHLGFCTIVFLLTCGDCTKSYERNILHQMNGTAFKGETVVFHCNGTLTSELKDIGWRKDGNLIFIYSPVKNRTVFNYTSSRMQVNPRNPRELQISDVQLSDAGVYSCFPLDMQWILTIEESEQGNRADPTVKYIVPSVTGAAVICVIIFCAVFIHRKYKKKEASDQRDTMDDHQPHGGRMNRNQNSQYFERFNSVYGQIQI